MTDIVSLTGIHKIYRSQSGAETHVLRGITLSIAEGQNVVLLGPSGCGKTTSLRIIAGLETPTQGRVELAGAVVSASNPPIWVGPEDRPIGIVFQSYALWPHMTVSENVAFALRHGRLKLRRAEARARTVEVLDMMQIGHLASRRVTQLSGGQQQRVALARAVAQRPKVLLMDEPLSNLDPQLRADVRGEIRTMTRQMGITSLIVTHDRDDALALADEVCVMADGVIMQNASPTEVLHNPASLFVARMFGDANALEAEVVAVGDGTLTLALSDSQIIVPHRGQFVPGSRVTLAAHSNRQTFAETGLPGEILESHYEADRVRSRVAIGGDRAVIYHSGAPLPPGSQVHVSTPDAAWMVFARGNDPASS
ncbi:ABC transporter ATP-binding protein [Pararhodobacter sp.]|uniref:ABC transporter ATP-binding protein n=1 Tax=Pararhodobacter sp. TaxID=2127056 RepID=UPI002AFDCE92|nr:ABC transporter ATP-binding protein [Pararhodobacter sp.]